MSLNKKIHNLQNIENLNTLSSKINLEENFESFIVILNDVSIDVFLSNLSNYSQLFSPFFDTKDSNDTLRIIVKNNVNNIQTFDSIKQITSYTYGDDYEDEMGIIEIKISKVNTTDYLTIYSLDLFTKFLSEKNIEDIFKLFSLFEKRKFKILDGGHYNFQTAYFVFGDSINFDNKTNQMLKNLDLSDREKKLKRINENTHFANASSIKFLPEDFYIINKSSNEALNKLFDKLTLTLVLRVFADISEFTKNQLVYKMYGYKTIKKEYDFINFDSEFIEDYFKSYEEIFNTHTSVSDKIGLARNVISLHVVKDDFTKIKGNIESSIKSNYNIYLKENVKKYIDVKNKINDSIFSLTNKFDDATGNLISSFKTSFYTLASLLISLILFKVLKSSSTAFDLFSIEVFLFLCPVLIAMYLFKKYNIYEIRETKKRLISRYEQLKSQYKDILDNDDLKQIFEQHNFEDININFIDNQISKYNKYWNITLISYFLFFFIGTFCVK
ncbi:MAG TPA: hypothetical protein CFH82_01440 [Sulfurospirillum sp. UBA12182]|nr:MAG TPA: hypothetical protein CFH82_01440 [Sulfurospirillum sp. UBA12182]